uniref:Uncharacterized protein n=1 Tax=Arundo donax TaxID=35708 RepID=A0A0A9DNY0_ARUDO
MPICSCSWASVPRSRHSFNPLPETSIVYLFI